MTDIVDVDDYGTLEQAKEVLLAQGWASPEMLSARDARVRAAAMEEAVKHAKKRSLQVWDSCENIGMMDPETGVRECTAETRGGGCLCTERFETLESIANELRALAAAPPGYVCVPVEPTREICEAMQRMPALTVEDLQLSQAGWSMGAIQNARRYRAITTSAKE